MLRLLLELVLKLNTFEFNKKYYLQTFGTAMGSKLAPAYANTFMGKLEAAILGSSPTKPTYYRRMLSILFLLYPLLANVFVDHFVETVRARIGAEITDCFSYDYALPCARGMVRFVFDV